MNQLYLLAALVTGAGISVQALANARLRLALGTPLWGAVGQFVVGLALLVVIALATRQPAPTTAELSKMPWWGWTGGGFGALFIVVSIVLTPRLGTALTLSTITVGQLLMALLLDHYGFLGGTVVRFSVPRALGAACLLVGIVLMRWKG